MLKKLFKLFEHQKPIRPDLPYSIIEASDHTIENDKISRNAIKVISQLVKAGHPAYLVGGGVRDLMLGESPKDFDIATEATPEQIKSVFRNSRIIGRRFRIVHVFFGREIIEVTTFRANHDQAKHANESTRSEQGMLLRDNVYGDITSDAERRDFTSNALYYDYRHGAILDFCGGWEDIQARRLKIIGKADDRYKEDPVRMLRAIRFATKLGFTIEEHTQAAIRPNAHLMDNIPSARRFEEVLKLFMSGYASATITNLRDFNLFNYLFPSAERQFRTENQYGMQVITIAAANTDKRIRKRQRVTPAFIYAAFLWPAVKTFMDEVITGENKAAQEALQIAAQRIIDEQLGCTAIPKRFLIPMREIWNLQLRLPRRDKRRAQSVVEHPRFRAAYDFLLLREEAGEDLDGLGSWWTAFQAAQSEDDKLALLKQTQAKPRKPRRKRPKNKNENTSQP